MDAMDTLRQAARPIRAENRPVGELVLSLPPRTQKALHALIVALAVAETDEGSGTDDLGHAREQMETALFNLSSAVPAVTDGKGEVRRRAKGLEVVGNAAVLIAVVARIADVGVAS